MFFDIIKAVDANFVALHQLDGITDLHDGKFFINSTPNICGFGGAFYYFVDFELDFLATFVKMPSGPEYGRVLVDSHVSSVCPRITVTAGFVGFQTDTSNGAGTGSDLRVRISKG